MADIYDKMVEAWKAPVVARSDIRRFSGGAICGKTLANLESKGIGPSSFKFRNRTCYETETLAAWMREWNSDLKGGECQRA
jgi:hypothetical protein